MRDIQVEEHDQKIIDRASNSKNLFFSFEFNDYEVADRVNEQVQKREEVINTFNSCFSKIGDQNIFESIQSEQITIPEVRLFLDTFNDFLKSDVNNLRILLYFPYEIINPELINLPQLQDSTDETKFIFKQAISYLLTEVDATPIFTNGDLGLAEISTVRKIGHLLPIIYQSGLIDLSDLSIFFMESDDGARKSIKEGITAGIELGIFSTETTPEYLYFSELSLQEDRQTNDDYKAINLNTLITDAVKEIQLFEEQIETELDDKRLTWQIFENKNSVIFNSARTFSKFLQSEELDIDNIWTYINSDQVSSIGLQIVIESIGLLSNFEKAHGELLNYCSTFQLENIDVSIQRTLNRLYNSGSISLNYACKILPSFEPNDCQYKIDIKIIDSEFEIRRMLEKIKEDSFLNQTLFPIIFLAGSRIKGYSEINSDTDLALCFRPEVDLNDRDRILEILQEKLNTNQSNDQFLEFWFDDFDSKQTFKNNNQSKVLNASNIQFILNSFIAGNSADFSPFLGKLLYRYVDLDRYGDQQSHVKSHLLRQLEMDTLQFRLLHKGFRLTHQTQSRQFTKNGDLIGWEGDFYDSGYRKLATKLFLQRVFIPSV